MVADRYVNVMTLLCKVNDQINIKEDFYISLCTQIPLLAHTAHPHNVVNSFCTLDHERGKNVFNNEECLQRFILYET